jgi:hypothetical protein
MEAGRTNTLTKKFTFKLLINCTNQNRNGHQHTYNCPLNFLILPLLFPMGTTGSHPGGKEAGA